MTNEEALIIINKMTPCSNCQYRNTGCKRADQHVWSDGFCHEVDEAIEAIMEALGINPIEPNDEEPYTPNNGNNEGDEEP